MDPFFPLVAMLVPIIAIAGGIVVAIARIIGQTRIEELARRERIAAIERGVDPEKLPPLPAGQELYGMDSSALRRAHGLMIGGLVVAAVGLGLGIIFATVEPGKNYWVVGLLPVLVGAALLVSARVVWPRKN